MTLSPGLICFSPTRTTRRIVEAVSEGLQAVDERWIDLTPPEIADPRVRGDLAVIATPVHAGRLPPIMVSRFRRLRGDGVPAVIIVVYGNRAYDDALLELRDVAVEAGFRPIAAGAFIGEHSFSSTGTLIAAGRPDAEDLQKARAFGATLQDRVAQNRALDRIDLVRVPGRFPYRELRTLPGVAPTTHRRLCTGCNECVAACPVGAIPASDPASATSGACIACCACVKRCSAGARLIDDSRIRRGAEQLAITCRARKEPETFVGSSSGLGSGS